MPFSGGHPAIVAALCAVLLAAGCAAVKQSAAPAVPAATAPSASQASASPRPPSQPVGKPVSPGTKAPAKIAAAQAPAKPGPAAQAAKPKTPPMDLKALETHLKETNAIGVMTKLSLKNQVDDLLAQFRAFYQGKLKTTLAELRRPFDLLVLKLLSLLQDSDPSLAAAILASREAIWGILSDRVKFATFDGG